MIYYREMVAVLPDDIRQEDEQGYCHCCVEMFIDEDLPVPGDKQAGEYADRIKSHRILTHHAQADTDAEAIQPADTLGLDIPDDAVSYCYPEEVFEKVGLEKKEQPHIHIQHKGKPAQEKCKGPSAQGEDDPAD